MRAVHAILGAFAGILVVAAFGAITGGLNGVTLGHGGGGVGFEGAFYGAVFHTVLLGLPACLVGALSGLAVSFAISRRDTSVGSRAVDEASDSEDSR